MGEGKAARVAGAAVTHAAIRYRNAAKAARARAGILLSAAAAWHPPWLKWRVSLGDRTGRIHPSLPRKPAWGRCSKPPNTSVSP